MLNLNQATFIKSAASLSDLPEDLGIEVAFAGRSNAGKSSALNRLTGNQRLAKTSKTPGRTQLINLFSVGEGLRLVDLPGYGYAKVPQAVKLRWQRTLMQYLEKRNCLKGLVLLTDIRHPPKPMDISMIQWAYGRHLPCHVLLTKADKLSYSKRKQSMVKIPSLLNIPSDAVSFQPFSATQNIGLDELIDVLTRWYAQTDKGEEHE